MLWAFTTEYTKHTEEMQTARWQRSWAVVAYECVALILIRCVSERLGFPCLRVGL